MATPDFNTALLVEQSPKEAFNAIRNVRGWWSEEIKGNTADLNDEFDYHFEDIHRCHIKITEVIADKKMVWQVTENYFKPGIFDNMPATPGENKFAQDKSEWTDTKMIFELTEQGDKTQIRFTHLGLVPEYECFDVCCNGWNHYIGQSLRDLITTGKGQPNSTGTPMTTDEEKFHTAAGQA